jgi:hypothetical protein
VPARSEFIRARQIARSRNPHRDQTKEDDVMTAGKGMKQRMKIQMFWWLVAAAALMLLSACGGGSSGGSTPPPTPATFTIGGTVSGLSGTGLVLQDNGADNLSIATNGSFTFSTAVSSGGAYKVTVLTQPSNPAQNCVVTSGSGTASANVTSVQVACTTTTFTIGGTVSGLSGSGLVLQDNGGDNLSITANSSFTFATAVDSGAAYKVTVLTEPAGPTQTCTVINGSGDASANVTNVHVTCTSANTFTIGGTVSGLSGTGLVLQDNGGNNLSITGNGSFTFSTALTSGSAYDVTVLTQPSSPAQTCTVTDGNGTANADVTSVQVACANQTARAWTWESGLNSGTEMGTYGTEGMAAPSNIPGSRSESVGWTDKSGNLWVFGGDGLDSKGTAGALGDLWEYSAGEWTWEAGPNTANTNGIYGTQGTPSPVNSPGTRYEAVSWSDPSGNFWLFGGFGKDSTMSINPGYLNDLWEFSKGEWTWVSGSDVVNQKGVYGTLGTASPDNVPGARQYAVSWTDTAGNLWLFGGKGYDSNDALDDLNDLWKFSKGEWTWVAGSNAIDQAGAYGTKGTAAPGNVPGAREHAVGWTDAAGNLWLFGGLGGKAGALTVFNDLWKFSGGQWTWMGGSNTPNQAGTYGTLGTPAPGNIPGARASASTWSDSAGNFWLFGGTGYGSTANYSGGLSLNDLWEYSGGEWTWVGGSDVNSPGANGVYGTEGTPAPGNTPGSRQSAVSWIDPAGNLWLFGGVGNDSTKPQSYLNDLWKYGP